MANEITIYRNNSKTILVTVEGLASLSGYTSVFTMKDKIGDSDLISNTGSTSGLNITFNLTPQETNQAADNYLYDVTVSNGTNNYTVQQSTTSDIMNH